MAQVDRVRDPALLAEPASLRVPILAGEGWWGGAVQDGSLMPFGRTSYARDLRGGLGGNQGAPLLISDRGRYIWCESAFSLAIEDEVIRLESERGTPVLCEGSVDLAGAYQAACSRHFPPSGLMPDPISIESPQYNTWIELPFEPTQYGVLAYAQGVLANGFPPGLLILDDNWAEDFGDWRFHSGRFPAPKEMIHELEAMGFRVMVWVCPFVSPDCATFRDLLGRGLLVRDSTGTPAIRHWWNGYSALLDLTNPECVAWLHDRMDGLIKEYGIAGFKMDGGDPECYRSTDLVFQDTTPVGHCEAWGRVGLRYGLSEYRSCWRLGGTRLIQRLRDKHPVWGRDGLADLIPNGLAQGLAGHAFSCPDMIGGGDIGSVPSGPVDQELFVRTAQCSALFPMMQLSAAPWRLLDARHLAMCRAAVELRQRMRSYLLQVAREAADTGKPMIRHLAFSFPGRGYESIQDQFMLGGEIMAAPVLKAGARERVVTFPPGHWQNDAGDCVVGPMTATVAAPLELLPWYRRVP